VRRTSSCLATLRGVVGRSVRRAVPSGDHRHRQRRRSACHAHCREHQSDSESRVRRFCICHGRSCLRVRMSTVGVTRRRYVPTRKRSSRVRRSLSSQEFLATALRRSASCVRGAGSDAPSWPNASRTRPRRTSLQAGAGRSRRSPAGYGLKISAATAGSARAHARCVALTLRVLCRSRPGQRSRTPGLLVRGPARFDLIGKLRARFAQPLVGAPFPLSDKRRSVRRVKRDWASPALADHPQCKVAAGTRWRRLLSL
jgi:hypothetical protein